MSSYIQKAYNPKTNKVEDATYIDDYFGKHRYGVKFSDGDVYREEEVLPYYEDMKTKLDEVLEVLYSNGSSAGRNSEIAKLSILRRYKQNDLSEAKQQISDLIDGRTEKVTRVEVIDENGRSYTNWNKDNSVELSFQDDNRTLKVFIRKKLKSYYPKFIPWENTPYKIKE